MIVLTIAPTIVVHVESPLPTGGGAPTIRWNLPRSWCARIIMLVLATCAAFAGQGVAFAHAAPGPFGFVGSFGKSGPSGGLLKEPRGVAVEAGTGDVFVMDAGDRRVVKYNAAGTAVLGEFTGGETPADQSKEFESPGTVAVDNSTAATKGDVYVTAGEFVDRFRPKGTTGQAANEYVYECQMSGSVGEGCKAEVSGTFGVRGMMVDSSGNVFYGVSDKVLELEAGASAGVQLGELTYPAFGIALAGSDMYVVTYNSATEPELVKFGLNSSSHTLEHEEAIAVGGGQKAVTVDPSGDVYVLDEQAAGESHVAEYASNATAGATPLEEFGTGEIGESWGIAYSAQGEGKIYITEPTNNQVDIFERRAGGHPPELEGCTVTKTPVSAKVACHIKPNASEATWELEFKTPGGAETEVTGGKVTTEGTVEGEITGLRAGSEYLWRITASSSGGRAHEEGSFVTLPAVERVKQCAASDVTGESATLGGSTLEPFGDAATSWYFDYGLTATYGIKTPEETSLSFPAVAQAPVGELEPNAEYHCRLVASDTYGTTAGQDGTFKTKVVPPLAAGEQATLIGGHAATLVGKVDPKNSATTFHFEYGATEPVAGLACRVGAYGQSTGEEAAGSGLVDATFGARIEDLEPGVTYHYRVVAVNENGEIACGSFEAFTTAIESAPAVATGAYSAVTQTTATVSGTVDPEGYPTTYTLEIGTSAAYGTQITGSAGSGSEPVAIAIPLQGLVAGVTYHYRFVAVNANGTSYGADQAFTTPAYSTTTSLMSTLPPVPAFVPTPIFPSVTTTTTKPKALTKAQKLSKALSACRRKPKMQRAKCERLARRKYEPVRKRTKA